MERLNARFVATVKATDDRQEILDVVARGLALRVSPKGVKSWSFRYRRRSHGRRRNVTLGVYPDHSLDAARLWATKCARRLRGVKTPPLLSSCDETPTPSSPSLRNGRETAAKNKAPRGSRRWSMLDPSHPACDRRHEGRRSLETRPQSAARRGRGETRRTDNQRETAAASDDNPAEPRVRACPGHLSLDCRSRGAAGRSDHWHVAADQTGEAARAGTFHR